MEQLRPETGNTLEIIVGLYLFLLIWCIPNAWNKSDHDTGSEKMSAKHKGGMVSVYYDNIVSSRRVATA